MASCLAHNLDCSSESRDNILKKIQDCVHSVIRKYTTASNLGSPFYLNADEIIQSVCNKYSNNLQRGLIQNPAAYIRCTIESVIRSEFIRRAKILSPLFIPFYNEKVDSFEVIEKIKATISATQQIDIVQQLLAYQLQSPISSLKEKVTASIQFVNAHDMCRTNTDVQLWARQPRKRFEYY